MIRKRHYLLLLLLMISIIPLTAVKYNVRKTTSGRHPKIHPYTGMLNEYPSRSVFQSKSVHNNKLLVILVDFQEEQPDDPSTTGNGKFLLDQDPGYKTTIGSPPHNREYYLENLEALRYYYLAASHNTFDLQYDVFPQTSPAYTLPNPMSYYNYWGISSELFLQRMEEYFKTSFELADSQDPLIDFSQYGHFMIIHAGSDWQHDYFGDTPSDLPSFFIRVKPGREAVVDNGTVQISYACNVPSTISQDFDTYESDGYTYYTGYGALNGVMAHEFGHSLGLVDLYNVYNYNPMVGQFDIMDSGGSGVTEDSRNTGVLIEGELPSLPGAFSRMLMFGDSFKQNGLFKELADLISTPAATNLISIAASSFRQTSASMIPNIYKIPVSQNEYILIENRSVDPDYDGGTAIKLSLDERVVLHPTAIADPSDAPTYEYDYLLPSFVDGQFHAVGGGLLIWHVDENLIYNEGQIGSDGLFVSNFDNNTINTDYNHRGVRIFEADGLEDIGNDNSLFWTGTAFEYFHKYKPLLDSSGLFVSWTSIPWRPDLNSETVPALLDYANSPSLYGLKDISQPHNIMAFRLTAGIFDQIYALGDPDTAQKILPVINSDLSDNVMAVIRNGMLHFYVYDPDMGISYWTEMIEPIQINSDSIKYEPIVSDVNNDGYKEVILVQNSSLTGIEYSGDEPLVRYYQNPDLQPISCAPVFSAGKLYAASYHGVYFLNTNSGNLESLGIPDGAYKLAATETTLLIQQKNKLILVDLSNHEIIYEQSLPEDFTEYEPIILINPQSGSNSFILTSDRGNIYKTQDNVLLCIYHNVNQLIPLTNLAVCPLNGYSPSLVFGQGNKLIAIRTDGSLLPGFPVYLEDFTAEPGSHIRVRRSLESEYLTECTYIYLRTAAGGYVTIVDTGKVSYLNSISDIRKSTSDFTYYTFQGNRLFWFLINNEGMLLTALLSNQAPPVFYWNGYRNGSTGVAVLSEAQPPIGEHPFSAYVFPNPLQSDWATIRCENPDGKIGIKIYDIAGKLLYKNELITNPVIWKDIQVNLSKFSSGVYILVADNETRQSRSKFALQR